MFVIRVNPRGKMGAQEQGPLTHLRAVLSHNGSLPVKSGHLCTSIWVHAPLNVMTLVNNKKALFVVDSLLGLGPKIILE